VTLFRWVLVVILATTVPVHGHQVDEYLQATLLDVSQRQITVELTLTPGVTVASQILSGIDLNGDERLDASEIEAYAAEVIQDLSVTIDGRPCSMAIVSARSPVWDVLRAGDGAMRIRAVSTLPIAVGHHRIEYTNAHLPAVSVYSVNFLKSSDSAVVLGAPQRDAFQERIRIDIEVTSPRGTAERAALLCLPIVTLLYVRWRRQVRSAQGRAGTTDYWPAVRTTSQLGSGSVD
jgi:hypothetical protein